MTPAHETLENACRRLASTSLEQVMTAADLQTRVDRKYLVPASTFVELLTHLDDRVAVLDIQGRRLFDYESVYFDTPGLLSYHRHAYGRRHRFKIRTRSYRNSGETVLEVKTNGGREETIKDRHPYPLAERYQLNRHARAIIVDHLGHATAAGGLEISLINRYQRATLLDPFTGSRMTCDVGLHFHNDEQYRTGPEDHVLLESKTTSTAAPVDTFLWRLGHRPASISKYCIGLAMLHPELPANRWNRTLRQGFGWTPDPRGPRTQHSVGTRPQVCCG